MRSSLKLGLALAVLTIGVASQAEAQTPGGDQASLTATVEVLQDVSLAVDQNINFGNVARGQTKSIDAAQAGAGRFVIGGAANTLVNFTFTTVPGALTNGLGSSIGVTWNACPSVDGSATGCTSAPVSTGTTIPVTLDGAGAHYVRVGASIDAGTATQNGTHTGTLVAEVLYN